jgi:hypothetical protein
MNNTMAAGKHQQRNAHVAGIVEHHRRQEGLQVQLHNPGQRVQHNARSEHNHGSGQCKPGILLQRSLLVSKNGEDQHGHEQFHVKNVQSLDVGRPVAAIECAATGDQKHRQHGGQNLANH